MKHNIESSLKRFLKRKVKITMGFVVAFLITGTVGFAESITGEQTFDKNVTIESSKEVDSKLTGIYVDKANKEANITGKTISIHTKDKGKPISGIYVVQGDKDNRLKLDISANLDIDSTSTDGNGAFGIFLQRYTDTTINGDIKINAVTDTNGKNEHTVLPSGLISKGIATFTGENFNLYSSSINGLNDSGIYGTLGIQISSVANTSEEIAKTTFNYKNMDVTSEGYGNGTVEAIKVLQFGSVLFNNDITNISAKSNRYAQGLVALENGNITFEKGDVHIVAELVNTPDEMPKPDKPYAAKGVTIQGGNVNFGENVKNVTIEAHGIGKVKEYNTLGVEISEGKLDVNSQNFNVIVDDGEIQKENDEVFTAGIRLEEKSEMSTSSQTTTNISINSALSAYGLQSYSKEAIFNGDTNINVNGNSGAFGISAKNGGTVSATGKNISIAATSTGGNATAVEANNGTGTGGEVVKLGGENTENIVLKANGKNFATGIEVVNHNPKDGQKIAGSKVEVNSKNLIIDVHSSDSEAAGIWVQNSTLKEGSTDKIANVVVNSENTVINVTSDTKGNALGLVAMSQGKLEVNGNLEVNAETAILTRGNAVTTINKNKDKTVKLNGDIEFNYDKPTSGTPVDATVDLNLSNAESFFKGKIVVTGEGIPENYEKVSNMNLGLSNKATWENTGDSFVSNLDLNNGIINNTSVKNDISVGTLKGNGGDINMVAEIEADGTATSGKLAIDKVDNKDAKFNVNYSGEGNLEVSQEEAKKVFEDLAENITVGEGNSFNANAKIEEGLISGEHTAEFVKGQGNEVVVKPNTVTTGSNSMVEGMRDLATINVLSWRQEMSSLNERMGELRNSTGSNGVWARVYGGKVENGSKYDNEYQTYQVGYDKKYPVENGDLFVGALVSYTDGKTDYNLGDGENYSVGAGIYATWLNRDGQFADVVLKQSRLHNKFDVRSKNGNLSQHGDYSNWGTSLSGQYGRRFDLDDKFFVEPSVQLTFGRVSSEDYTTSAGVKVEQDTAYTLVGDVGTAVGYKFSDKGNVYARASLVKEFKGDIDTKYSYGGATEYTSEDLSDTWGEFGVGVNYRIRENVNMYVDIQRTEEATVENKWQTNLGFRWEF